jgi:dihydrofolate synthase/folylpolyglutamate synthase
VTKPTPKPITLEQWLAYIEALHPKKIAMGLARVEQVAERLNLNTTFPIITVAGTNGKGSTCAMLEAIYAQSGYRVGCYTSPHLLRYNERVRVNQQEIADDDLCKAFAAVEAARGDIQLTYFEMGTLAAMWHFVQIKLDVVILEVGMGGRLDAVNVFEPDCAIVTSIDLDHMEFLGDTREKIGLEKAGIYRSGKLAVCGDANPPKSLTDHAQEIGANFKKIGRDFTAVKTKNGWQFSDTKNIIALSDLALHGDFQINNAACAMCAVQHLGNKLPVLEANIYAAFRAVALTGRFQSVRTSPTIIVDVAHNPQAAQSLAHNLHSVACTGRTLAVFAMLADKDIAGVVREVAPYISAWYLADIYNARGAKAADLQRRLSENASCQLFENVASALQAACQDAAKNDRIIVFGSFYTVADAIKSLNI